MATPRWAASTSLTVRPPIWSVPDEISSSPATMRSKVDLPQPDGPTKTVNAPSGIVRSTPWMTWTGP